MLQQGAGQTGAEHRFAVFLWIAMLAAIAIYFVVMRLISPPEPKDNPALVTGALGMAVVLVAVSFVVKGRLLGQARETGKAELRLAGRILGLILCETAALLGFVTWMLTGSTQAYYPLIAGFVGMLLHFPAREIG